MSLRHPGRKQPARQPSPATGNPALDLFHRNWQALEKLQAKIDKQALNGRDIYQRFTSEIEPLERQQCELIFALAKRLVDFTARKSFTLWQRETLHHWIHDLISYIESNPFRGEMDLAPLFHQIQTNTALHMDDEQLDYQCDVLTQMLMETCGHCPDDIDTLREMLKNPDRLNEYMMNAARQHMAEECNTVDKEEDARFDDDELFADEPLFGTEQQDAFAYACTRREQEEEARIEQLFSKSSLKQLYRKLALALHPDREPDPVMQAEKTRIMGQLSQAWENKEMFTLLQLAHTHLPEFDNLLSDENLAYLNPMLKRQLRELEVSYYGGQDGLMGAVLHKFKQSSKKKTEQAFAEHRDYLLRDIDHLTAQLAEITTLQTLKPYLAARWDQKQMRWDEEEDDMEWLFR